MLEAPRLETSAAVLIRASVPGRAAPESLRLRILVLEHPYGRMADAWLGNFGIRVTNFEKSIEFYTHLLDLEELKRVVEAEYAYVLLRDRRSGQRLELNWYAPSSPFWAPYVPGEGLDHLEV